LGYTLPLHTLVLLLGLVFCVASPLIAPVTLLYFVSSSVAQRYQWIYIYRHPYEGAGTLWRQVFTQVCAAVVCCETATIAHVWVRPGSCWCYVLWLSKSY
jgi:hypothetical protein